MLVGLLLDLSHLGVSKEEPPLSVGAAARHQGEVDLLIYSENFQASSAPYLEGPRAGFTVFCLPPPPDDLSLQASGEGEERVLSTVHLL